MGHREVRRRKTVYIQVAVSVLLLLALLAGYVAALHATVPISRKTSVSGIEDRDQLFVLINGGILVLGVVIGFLAGKWYGGLGFAIALLFLAVLGGGLVGIQLGSFAAACHGHNDIVRHWSC